MWLTYKRKRMWFSRIFGGMVFLTAAGMFFGRDALVPQFTYLYQALLGMGSQTADVTEGVVCLAFLLSYTLFSFEILLKSHWTLYLITTVFLLLGPLLGIYPGISSVILLVVFQFAFWGIHSVKKYGKKRLRNQNLGKNLTGQIGTVILSGTAVILAASLLFVQIGSEWLYQAAYGAESQVQRTVKSLMGTIDDPIRGSISRGNLYPTGEDQLILWTQEQPTETIYLKGFVGGDYSGGQWQDDPVEEVFQSMDENSLHWGRWASWAESMFNSMYYVVNGSMQERPHDYGREMYVQNVNDSSDTWYTPYFSIWGRQGQRERTEDGYNFYYFQQNEMDIDWGNISPRYGDNGETYLEIQNAYMKEANVTYTRVPMQSIPRLVQLCEDNSMNSLEEITAFIQTTLAEQASYSQTPGLFPLNEDPVEYFLFDSREGYCQHFASAAVLMYRLYGVPARYVTGYAVSPEDFQEQEDGGYQANVTDASAHAWPEIFLEDQGWTPVEVTPGNIDVVTSNHGLDAELLDQAFENGNWNLNVFQNRLDSETQREGAGNLSGIPFEENFPDAVEILAWAVVICFLFLTGIFLNRRRQLQYIQRMNGRRLYGKMVDCIHFCGILREMDGTEEDFSKNLAEKVPMISREESENLIELVNQAAFSEKSLEKDEVKRIRNIYFRVAETLYRQLSPIRKLLFKYLYTYL